MTKLEFPDPRLGISIKELKEIDPSFRLHSKERAAYARKAWLAKHPEVRHKVNTRYYYKKKEDSRWKEEIESCNYTEDELIDVLYIKKTKLWIYVIDDIVQPEEYEQLVNWEQFLYEAATDKYETYQMRSVEGLHDDGRCGYSIQMYQPLHPKGTFTEDAITESITVFYNLVETKDSTKILRVEPQDLKISVSGDFGKRKNTIKVDDDRIMGLLKSWIEYIMVFRSDGYPRLHEQIGTVDQKEVEEEFHRCFCLQTKSAYKA